MTDVRFMVGVALGEAGLARTDYARNLLMSDALGEGKRKDAFVSSWNLADGGSW